jgi:hypothetical protein
LKSEGYRTVKYESTSLVVIPAQAGIQEGRMPYAPTIIPNSWMPVFTGMTDVSIQQGAQKFSRAPIEMSTAPLYSVLGE